MIIHELTNSGIMQYNSYGSMDPLYRSTTLAGARDVDG